MTEISDRAIRHLDHWFSQKPTFALMGEFSAGKSTLLNLILGEVVLPTKVTATNLPVIWMTYGDTPTAEALTHDGRVQSFDFADLTEQGKHGHLLIRLSLPSETLKRSDVIDTPGISDRRLAANALDFITPYLDFVVWCSAANQAWRQTEKAVWQKMPQETQDLSILALTRADMMTKANSLAKVIKRCETETAGMFRLVQPIATVVALKAMDAEGEVQDATAWETSHADTLFAAIKDSLRIAKLNCALRETVAVPEDDAEGTYTSDPKATSVDAPAAEVPETKVSESPVAAPIVTTEEVTQEGDPALENLLSGLRQLEKGNSRNGQLLTTLDHLFSQFRCETKASDKHRLVLDRAMSLDGSSEALTQLVTVQMVNELEDFANNPWRQLD